ncbi:MAG: hypothetical protein HY815_18645 [Candidatus Riflebacteria bacterium]|nr:hypothetical protein [Candidatus Riflebacteria bacterium]
MACTLGRGRRSWLGARDRSGVTVTLVVAMMLLVLMIVAGAAWVSHRGTTTEVQGGWVGLRAEQLARGAIAEAMHRVAGWVNVPRARFSPGKTWFELVRCSGGDRAVATIPVPITTDLAGREEFTLSDVEVLCPRVQTHQGVGQGVLEARVVIAGGQGPWPVKRRLVERRVFYNPVRQQGTGWQWTDCTIQTNPLARLYERW